MAAAERVWVAMLDLTFSSKVRKAAAATRLESLSHRAKVFRSKLIEDFQILETTSEKGKRKVPVYNTTDVRSKI